jgi:hypothetical protein
MTEPTTARVVELRNAATGAVLGRATEVGDGSVMVEGSSALRHMFRSAVRHGLTEAAFFEDLYQGWSNGAIVAGPADQG